MTDKGELVGNFEIDDKNVHTRREVLLMGAMAAGTLIASTSAAEADPAVSMTKPIGPYTGKDFGHLVTLQMPGLSGKQIEQHLKLYKGYVNKANEITLKLKSADMGHPNPTYSPYRELLVEQSYAHNGVIYHELYFGNLGGKGGEPAGELRAAVESGWGSLGKFMDHLKATGKCMRGWAIIGFNTRDGQLASYGLDLHNMFVPANVIPLLVLDVYEHAYMIDYGIDRGKYLDAFLSNLNWDVVSKRLTLARKHPTGHESTV